MHFKYPKDLTQGLRYGDEKAMEYLSENWTTILVYCSYWITKDKMESEDIAQRSLMKAWENRTNFENESKLSNFLFKCTRNESINFLRKTDTKNKYKNYITALTNSEEDDDATKKELEQMALFQKVYEIAMQLPGKQRRTFELLLMNKTFAEIAGEMQVAQSTARNNFQKALTNIRKALGINPILLILWVQKFF